MRHSKSRLLMLAACAMASIVAASETEASSQHVRKHHARQSQDFRNHDFRNSWATGDVRPVAPRAGTACPGNARAIDCTVWPPPFDDDPDRKATSSDGG